MWRVTKRWKKLLDVQAPYRWNIKRLNLGPALDIGCGIGRILQNLPKGSVGVDHNKTSIDMCRDNGLEAYLPKDFHKKYAKGKKFESMILSHVLEHVSTNEGKKIIKEYAPLVKSKIVIICPQKKGFASDDTHVNFLKRQDLEDIAKSCGFTRIEKSYSFPFPTLVGEVFTYNETVVVASRP